MKNFILLLGVILAIYGCETTDGGAGEGGEGGTAGSGGEAGTGGTAGSAGAGGEGGTGGGVAACPDPTGNFGNPSLTGTGCGQLSNQAVQRILTSATQCQFEMNSGVTGPPGLNGLFLLDMAGTFSNTTFQVGTGSLIGCDGVWTDATSTMVVTCTNCTITLR